MNARKMSIIVACIGAAAGLTACDRSVTSSDTTALEMLTPVSRAYVVESGELIEIGRFEDGSVKYTPTGWMVISPSTSATATAASLRH